MLLSLPDLRKYVNYGIIFFYIRLEIFCWPSFEASRYSYLDLAQPVWQGHSSDDPDVIQGQEGEVPEDDEEVDAEGELVDQGSGLISPVLLVPHHSHHQSVPSGQNCDEQSRGDQP